MPTTRESGLLTVAAIRRRKNEPPRYLFHERQRIFTLAERGVERAARYLEEARAKRRPVKVSFDGKRGVIQRVSEPTERESEEFARTYVSLKRPSKIVPIEVDDIDPFTFNFVDRHLRWPVFRLCDDIVSSYGKAKQIFDFCAQLSCSLPGPYAVTPCVPFQYVIDGCYARAHQMRRIITTRYGYCCEKVFSFATANDDTLAVQANKWGGCCVTWWYHVAPLVRVRLRLRGIPRKLSLVLAMVIDPGMFDKPVLLSTWLAAQENTTCSPHAHVTSYSIQPGSAYTPSFGGGFSTDPNYTQTEATLIAYRNLTTC
jgi:Glutaminase